MFSMILGIVELIANAFNAEDSTIRPPWKFI